MTTIHNDDPPLIWDFEAGQFVTVPEYVATLDRQIARSRTWRYRIRQHVKKLRHQPHKVDTGYLVNHRAFVLQYRDHLEARERTCPDA